MAVGIAEIILLLTLGGSAGPTGFTQSQPLLWLGGYFARGALPLALIVRVGAPHATTLSGPVGIVPPPPPSALAP